MQEYRFPLMYIFPYKGRFFDSARKRRVRGNPYSHIFYAVHVLTNENYHQYLMIPIVIRN